MTVRSMSFAQTKARVEEQDERNERSHPQPAPTAPSQQSAKITTHPRLSHVVEIKTLELGCIRPRPVGQRQLEMWPACRGGQRRRRRRRRRRRWLGRDDDDVALPSPDHGFGLRRERARHFAEEGIPGSRSRTRTRRARGARRPVSRDNGDREGRPDPRDDPPPARDSRRFPLVIGTRRRGRRAHGRVDGKRDWRVHIVRWVANVVVVDGIIQAG